MSLSHERLVRRSQEAVERSWLRALSHRPPGEKRLPQQVARPASKRAPSFGRVLPADR
jgi:hypothetical protein